MYCVTHTWKGETVGAGSLGGINPIKLCSHHASSQLGGGIQSNWTVPWGNLFILYNIVMTSLLCLNGNNRSTQQTDGCAE